MRATWIRNDLLTHEFKRYFIVQLQRLLSQSSAINTLSETQFKANKLRKEKEVLKESLSECYEQINLQHNELKRLQAQVKELKTDQHKLKNRIKKYKK